MGTLRQQTDWTVTRYTTTKIEILGTLFDDLSYVFNLNSISIYQKTVSFKFNLFASVQFAFRSLSRRWRPFLYLTRFHPNSFHLWRDQWEGHSNSVFCVIRFSILSFRFSGFLPIPISFIYFSFRFLSISFCYTGPSTTGIRKIWTESTFA